ncbi:hypothetical protein RT717_17850 [Imperialibacter roseus]|uniref:Transmembrane protein n=1 Tax=Imperialibacter roseus TaxID=1324217 RepID=A0ABZ0IK91_9BACT|nr:hypothetical protein [Imperialibacter roseus]WOK04947.1 hypothetical protein RT717_17850 [Imperialibacter roseus]
MSRPIASCPLADPDDQKNHLNLFASYLEVVRKGKSKKYALTPIMRLEINHRQLLGPLIGGGLLSCIAFITLFSWNKWAALLLVLGIGGMGLMYYGLVGVKVLTLKEDKIRYDIMLPGIGEAMPAFISFYNHLIPRMALGVSHVFPVYLLKDPPSDSRSLYLVLPDMSSNQADCDVVDLMKLSMELHFEYDGVKHYRAKVDGPVPTDAFIERSDST